MTTSNEPAIQTTETLARVIGRSHLAAIARAARRGQLSDPAVRQESIAVCQEILRDHRSRPRLRLAAENALAELQKLEQEK